jgi:hypothetical protein
MEECFHRLHTDRDEAIQHNRYKQLQVDFDTSLQRMGEAIRAALTSQEARKSTLTGFDGNPAPHSVVSGLSARNLEQ